MARRVPRNIVQVRPDLSRSGEGSTRGFSQRRGFRRRAQRTGLKGLLRDWGLTGRPPRSSSGRRRRRGRSSRINFRTLGATVVVLSLAVPALAALHRWQVDRLSENFSKAAANFERKQRWSDAIKPLRGYCKLRPEDVDGMGRLGRALLQDSPGPNEEDAAVKLFAKATSLEPRRYDLQAGLATALLNTNPARSLEICEGLLKQEPDNAQYARLRALAMDYVCAGPHNDRVELTDRRDVRGVLTSRRKSGLSGVGAGGNMIPAPRLVDAYRRSLELNPTDAGASLRLATILQLRADELAKIENVDAKQIKDRADRVVDAMVKNNSRTAAAYLARYRYRKQFHRAETRRSAKEGLDPDVQDALGLEPTSVEARLAAAENLAAATADAASATSTAAPLAVPQAMAEIDRHLKYLGGAVNDRRACLAQAQSAWIQGRTKDAVGVLQHGVAVHREDLLLKLRLAAMLVDAGEEAEAFKVLDDLDERTVALNGRIPDSDVANLEAASAALRVRILLGRKGAARNLTQAVAHLTRAAKRLTAERSPLAYEVHLLLGECRREEGRWDLAAENFSRALTIEPSRLAPRLGYAASLQGAGRYDEAVAAYSVVLHPVKPWSDQTPLGPVWFELARCQLARALAAPDRPGLWKEVEESAAKARELAPNSPPPIFLELEVLLARSPGAEEQAVDRIRRERPRFEKNVQFWKLAAETFLRLHRTAEAAAAVDRIETLTKSKTPVLRSRLSLSSALGAGSDALVAYDGTRAEPDVGLTIYGDRPTPPAAANPRDEVDAAHRAAMSRSPASTAPLVLLADAAVRRRNVEELRELEGKFRALPEDRFLADYYSIHRRYLEWLADPKTGLQRASSLSQELLANRPQWPASHAAAAMVHEARGAFNDAIRGYRQAMKLSNVDQRFAAKTAGLLLRNDQSAEASEIFLKLSDEMRTRPELLLISAMIAAQTNRLDDALTAGKRAVESRPDDASAWLALGLLHQAKRRADDVQSADRAFRTAAQLRPDDLRIRLAQLRLHLKGEHPDRLVRLLEASAAASTLLRARALSDVAETRLVCAFTAELDGDFKGAEAFRRSARQAAGSAPLLSLFPDEFWSKTSPVASAQAPAPSSEQVRLLGLIERPSASAGSRRDGETADAEWDAAAMLQRGRRLSQAAERLRKIPVHQRRPGVHRILARLLLSEGRSAQTLGELRQAEPRDGSGDLLAELCEYSLVLGEISSAAETLAQLRTKAPEHAELARLTCLLKAAEGEASSAVREAIAWATAGSKADRLRRCDEAAGWLTRLETSPEVVALFAAPAVAGPAAQRTAVEWLSRKPASAVEALRRAGTLASQDSALPTAPLLAELLLQTEDEAVRREVHGALDQALDRDALLRPDLAATTQSLKNRAHRTPQNLRLFRWAFLAPPRKDSVDGLAAAFISSDALSPTDRLRLLDPIVLAAGPAFLLQMERARLLIAMEKTAEAVALLDALALIGRPDPAPWLELTAANRRSGLRTESNNAWKVAGLSYPRPLDVDERRRMRSLTP